MPNSQPQLEAVPNDPRLHRRFDAARGRRSDLSEVRLLGVARGRVHARESQEVDDLET